MPSALSFQLRTSDQLFWAVGFWIRDVSIRLIPVTSPANRRYLEFICSVDDSSAAI
jgi:hypothetical protein